MKQLTGAKHRLLLSAIGIATILGIWERATNHLYSLPQKAYSSFTSFTNNAFYVIGVIVVFAVTGKLVWDWKNATVSAVTQATEIISKKIHVIEEGTSGAPETRPWSRSAVE